MSHWRSATSTDSLKSKEAMKDVGIAEKMVQVGILEEKARTLEEGASPTSVSI